MNMKEIYIKAFKKHKAVIIKRINESGRVTTHWAIPSPDNIVNILGLNDAIVLHSDAKLLSTKRNIPTYFVTYKDCQPLTLTDLKREGVYSTAKLKLILQNDLAQKAFKAGNENKISDEAKLILIVIIAGLIGLGYFLNMKIAELDVAPAVEPIVEDVIDSE